MPSSSLRRYLPLVAIVMVQFVLVGVQSQVSEPATKVTAETSEAAAQGGDVAATGDSVGSDPGAPVAAPEGATKGPGGDVSAARGRTPTGGGATTSTTPKGSAGAGGPSGGAARSAQLVDSLGRPTAGDKSKCAPGGQLQENVTSFAVPCMPKFTGDNGGATSSGVTGDQITIVVYYPRQDPTTSRALAAAEVAATEQQFQEGLDIYAEFFNRHYEFYGRKIKPITFFSQCASSTPECVRADAKEIAAKYRPFMAPFYGPGAFGPLALADALSQLGIITYDAQNNVPASWYQQRRPYVWNILPDGDRMTDMLSDYYCKRLMGKPAALAGDPTMHIKRRKYGLLTSEEPPLQEMAQRLRRLLSGGRCGTPSDVAVYTTSTDPTTAQNQQGALITRMKNDGVTTVSWLQGNVLGCQECDRQQFFPEQVTTGMSLEDLDVVGRLDADTSRDNRFGLGLGPKARPRAEQDYRKAAADVNPKYEIAYPPGQGGWLLLSFASLLIQWAGPNLTPTNLEKGAHSSPQLQGWTNAQPWPGWKCCDPYQRQFKLAGGSYTAVSDARQVYWDSKAISTEDNQPGAWICVDDCKRYEAGQWPAGEPKRP